MKTFILSAALLAGAVTTAAAGGYTAPVADPVPAVIAAPVAQPSSDWTGAYAGLQVGAAKADFGLPPDYPLSSIDMDGRNYGLHVGYLHDFGRFVGGAELSYDKLDDFEVAGVHLDDLGLDLDSSLLRAKLIAGFDAGRVLPYAAVSIGRATLELDGDEGSETGFGYGIGAKFMVTPRFMAGVEWMRNDFEVSDGGDDIDIDLSTISLSASFRF